MSRMSLFRHFFVYVIVGALSLVNDFDLEMFAYVHISYIVLRWNVFDIVTS